MPRLWHETIKTHRHAVREAILDVTWELLTEHGVTAVTMSQIADRVGIGRATLYKYFPDVESILVAWHHRQVAAHLEYLTEIRDRVGDPGDRLSSVLRAYALNVHRREHHSSGLVAFLHTDEHLAAARERLHGLVRDTVVDAAATGDVRGDIAPDVLARYCLHALGAASDLPSEDAVHRLVSVTLAGLRPQGSQSSAQA